MVKASRRSRNPFSVSLYCKICGYWGVLRHELFMKCWYNSKLIMNFGNFSCMISLVQNVPIPSKKKLSKSLEQYVLNEYPNILAPKIVHEELGIWNIYLCEICHFFLYGFLDQNVSIPPPPPPLPESYTTQMEGYVS